MANTLIVRRQHRLSCRACTRTGSTSLKQEYRNYRIYTSITYVNVMNGIALIHPKERQKRCGKKTNAYMYVCFGRVSFSDWNRRRCRHTNKCFIFIFISSSSSSLIILHNIPFHNLYCHSSLPGDRRNVG